MITWDDIINMDLAEEELLVEMQEGIRETLAAGGDPGPSVAFALIRELTARLNEEGNIEERLANISVYVLGLETRLLEAGYSFAEPDTSIRGE